MQLEHSFTVPVGIDDAWRVLLDIERIAPCMPGVTLETVDGDDFTGTVSVTLGPIALSYKGKAGFAEKDEAAHRATITAEGDDAGGNGAAAALVIASLTDQGTATKVDIVAELDLTGEPAQLDRGVIVDVGNAVVGQFAERLADTLSGGNAVAPSNPPVAEKITPAKTTKAAVKRTTKTAPAKATKSTPAKKAVAKEAAAKKPATKRTAAAKKSTPAATAPVTQAPPADEPSVNGASVPAAVAEPTPTVEPMPTPVQAAEPTAPAPVQPGPRHVAPSDVDPIDLLEHAGPTVAKRLVPVAAAVVLLLIILRLRKR